MINYKYSTLALAIVALLSGCGAEDNKSLDDNNNNIFPPIVEGDVTIPALHVGLTVQGAYQYFDPNPAARPEGNSLYSWRYGDVELSTKKSLDLNYEFYDLVGKEGSQGESIRFCVTPIAQGSNTSVGEETCSELREVKDALGEKPTATDIYFGESSNMIAPVVGEILTATYQFVGPGDSTYAADEGAEGDSLVVWYAGDQKIKTAVVADDNKLELTPRNSEDKKIGFCIVPESAESVPGYEVCTTDPTGTVAMHPDNEAPYVKEGTGKVQGYPVEYTTLTGKYTWVDKDDDVKAPSLYSWKRGSIPISDENLISYETTSADVNSIVSFCVQLNASTGKPIGENTCFAMTETIKENTEKAPTADVTIEGVENGIEVGDELAGSYEYRQADDVGEGETTAWWQIGNDEPVPCNNKDNCNYTLTTADLEKEVQFCVLPVTENKKPADKNQCSVPGLQASGIKLSGVLEYDNTLTADVIGYSGYSNPHWRVNVDDQKGPTNDTAAVGDASRTEQGVSLSYKIGVRDNATDAPRQVKNPKYDNTDKFPEFLSVGSVDVKDDYDWLLQDTIPPVVDARNFIGKSLEFCLEVKGDAKCVNAADYTTVTGGLYYDEEDETKRAIEPIREVQLGDVTYHRTLSVAEFNRTSTAEFGVGLPIATNRIAINGIDWALFAHNEKSTQDVLNACRNLHSVDDGYGSWHLPIGYFGSGYNKNIYSENGNNPSVNKDLALKYLNEQLISAVDNSSYKMSPVFGWPVDSTADKKTYATASRKDKQDKLYVIRLYGTAGSNSSTEFDDSASFVSCVKE